MLSVTASHHCASVLAPFNTAGRHCASVSGFCCPVLIAQHSPPGIRCSATKLPRVRRRKGQKLFVAKASPSLGKDFRALLAAGADPRAAPKSAGTLLHLAAGWAHEQLVKLLLSTQVGQHCPH